MDENEARDDALLDLEHKSNDELRGLLDELYAEEQRVSYRRRVLHGKIDILRAELVRRLKAGREGGERRHQRSRRRSADRDSCQRPAWSFTLRRFGT